MLDLEAISGLPLRLTDGVPTEWVRLEFGPGVVVAETCERSLDALTEVVLEPELCRGRREAIYTMYNGVYRSEDAAILRICPVRYELTLIPAGRIGRESIKTHGHLHSTEPQSGRTYAEVCEVLVGTAHFLFQTLNPHGPDASLAVVIEAGPGDKVVIPPDLDHLTINPGPGPLLFADVIALDCHGVYERYKAARGAAYLEMADDSANRFIPNPRYREVAPLQSVPLRDYPEVGLTHAVPLYTAFIRGGAANWAFLTDPQQFRGAFPDLEPLQPQPYGR